MAAAARAPAAQAAVVPALADRDPVDPVGRVQADLAVPAAAAPAVIAAPHGPAVQGDLAARGVIAPVATVVRGAMTAARAATSASVPPARRPRRRM